MSTGETNTLPDRGPAFGAPGIAPAWTSSGRDAGGGAAGEVHRLQRRAQAGHLIDSDAYVAAQIPAARIHRSGDDRRFDRRGRRKQVGRQSRPHEADGERARQGKGLDLAHANFLCIDGQAPGSDRDG